MGAFSLKKALSFAHKYGQDLATACEMAADVGELVGAAPVVADTLRTAADAGRIASGQPRAARKPRRESARAPAADAHAKPAPLRVDAVVTDAPKAPAKRRKGRPQADTAETPRPPVRVLTATVGQPDPDAWKRHLPRLPK